MAPIKTLYDVGYEVGLSSIKTSLERMRVTGDKDLHYWKDSIRWISKSCNAVGERQYVLPALDIIIKVQQLLGELIRPTIIKAVSTINLASRDADVLNVVTRFLAEIVESTDSKETTLNKFVTEIITRIYTSGDSFQSIASGTIAALIRLIGKMNDYEMLYDLAKVILTSGVECNGKILWTLADVLCEIKMTDFDLESPWLDIWIDVGRTLVRTSNIKAKQHLAKLCCHILDDPYCPADIKSNLKAQLNLCREWLERLDAPEGLDGDLFIKYKTALEEQIAKVRSEGNGIK